MFHPYKLWSLWDMLRFHAPEFMNISNLLCKISHTFDVWKAEGKKRPRTLNLPAMQGDLDWLYRDLTGLGLTMSAKCAKRFIEIVKSDNIDPDKLNILAQELNQRIIDELQECNLFMVSSEKANYYNPSEPIWGKESQDRFPELIEDIAEANNCFALERQTACVFHLMRVMERAVKKMADQLRLPIKLNSDKEWQRVINDIRGQLQILYPKHADADRIKYEAALGHLETVKIAWRNPTMHPKATYTEEEAKAILNAVEIFVKDLVKTL
jgi:hypothetical protein